MINISAQVSLYPLGKEDLSPVIDEALNNFHHHSLDVTPGSMSTLIFGDDVTVFSALQETFQRAAKESRVVMVVTFSNACPLPRPEKQESHQEKKTQG
ncbi:MAG: thiamine-binding protein [Anaerolineales bacterium]|nr:thiamine-binding protein [Anaerolineales bacterium]